MAYLERILAGTDFSIHAGYAEERAAMLAATLGSPLLELMTVIEPGRAELLALLKACKRSGAEAVLVEEAMRGLEQRSQRLRESHRMQCSQAVRIGRAAQEIAARAEEMDADLIVVGKHGGGMLSGMFMGNTADHLVRLTRRSLLIAKQAPERPYTQVLVPVDFSADAVRAAQVALRVAPGAHITFLHAFQVGFEGQMRQAGIAQDVIDEYRVKAAEDARRELNEFIAERGPSMQLVSRAIKFGCPRAVIRNHAQAMRPDLIVMGRHGRSRLQELLLGSVTRSTIEETDCDVLVTSPVAAEEDWRGLDAA